MTGPGLTPSKWAQAELATLDSVIAYMDATSEDSWRVGTVRSADGTTNCFFGHLFNMGGSDDRGSALWDWFEDKWATTYKIYPINDGKNPDYPQATPRQRVMAYLLALSEGTELTTSQAMEEYFRERMAEESVLRTAG
ncbi:hypothetical protein [Arthrobacter sp. IK3]|uniref:hypothetical protein n=1 Tax=Arthrobacter sp. IK3 TaxID=3448169 RepID=UPI003EE0B47F